MIELKHNLWKLACLVMPKTAEVTVVQWKLINTSQNILTSENGCLKSPVSKQIQS